MAIKKKEADKEEKPMVPALQPQPKIIATSKKMRDKQRSQK